jgi:putative CocE/NonD family hydrolase
MLTDKRDQGAPPQNETWIDFDRRVPMRDGVELSADVYRPCGDGRHPAILMRTPYLKTGDAQLKTGRYFAERGYALVWMDVRGRGDSGGVFVPYRNDGRDGYDAIEWCAAQPWSDGNVGTMGGSYLGRIQWLAALERPPHLRAMIVSVTPSDPFVEWPTGTPGPMHICWHHMTSGHALQNTSAVDWMQVYEHLPLLTMDERAGRPSPHWRAELAHEQLDDYWRAICYQDKFEQIDLPVLHISGWYDDELIGTPLNYMGMVAGGATPEARARQPEAIDRAVGPPGQHCHKTWRGRFWAERADRSTGLPAALVRPLAEGRIERHHGRAAGTDIRDGRESLARRAGVAASSHATHTVLPA